jgi:tetratricopeptide (TPR) repeat protein
LGIYGYAQDDPMRDFLCKDLLCDRRVIIFCDSFNVIEEKLKKQDYDCCKIAGFLKSDISGRTSLLLTSSNEKIFFDTEKRLLLDEGLSIDAGVDLFKHIVSLNSKFKGQLDEEIIVALVRSVKGHPVFIEQLAKEYPDSQENIRNDYEQSKINPDEYEKITKTSIDHSLDKLDTTNQKIIMNLTKFKTSFPLKLIEFLIEKADSKISDDKKKQLTNNLRASGLVKRVDSDDNRIKDALQVYDFRHRLVKDYMYTKLQQHRKYEISYENSNLLGFYKEFLDNSLPEIDRGEPGSRRVFRILLNNPENNDLEDKSIIHDDAEYYDKLGTVFEKIGDFARSYKYHEKALEIDNKKEPKHRINIARDLRKMGLALARSGRSEESFSYFNKSLGEYRELKGVIDSYLKLYKSRSDIEKELVRIVPQIDAESAKKQIDSLKPEQEKIDPEIARIYLHKALAYRDLGMYKEAKENLDLSFEYDSSTENEARVKHIEGTIERNTGNFKKAEQLLDESKIIYSDRRKIGNEFHVRVEERNIAVSKWMDGQFEDALKRLEHSCKKYDEENSYFVSLGRDFVNIGMCYAGMGRYSEAIKNVKEALKTDYYLNLKGNFARDLLLIGIVYRYAGFLNKSLCNLKIGLKLNEESKNNFGSQFSKYYIGMVFRDMGQFRKAIKYFHESLMMDLNQENDFLRSNIFRQLSISFRDMLQLVSVTEEIKDWHELPNMDEENFVRLGSTLRTKRDLDVGIYVKLARKYLDLSKKKINDKSNYSKLKNDINSAITYRIENDPGKSVEELSKILDRIPADNNNNVVKAKVLRHLGIANRDMEEYDKAIGFLNDALKSIDCTTENEVEKARIYRHLGITYSLHVLMKSASNYA